LPILGVTIHPLFYGKACVPKNIILTQNWPRAMMNIASTIYFLRVVIILSAIIMLFLGQGMICSGLHTCLVTTDLGGMTTASCSIDHCFRSRCNPLFKYETSLRDTTSVVSNETASLPPPMMTFFPLAFSAWSRRISTYGLFNSSVSIRKGLWSTFISRNTKRP
jgi:hypothetical protein